MAGVLAEHRLEHKRSRPESVGNGSAKDSGKLQEPSIRFEGPTQGREHILWTTELKPRQTNTLREQDMQQKAAKTLLAVVMLCASLGAADAADRKRKREVVREPDRWTGFYLGGHLGQGWDNMAWNWNIPDNASIPDQTVYTSSLDKRSFLGGAQVGYLHSFGPIVSGLEFAYTAHSSSSSTSITDTADTRTLNGRIGDIYALTGKLGYGTGSWLTYAKGGLAWADIKLNSTRATDNAVQTSSSGLAPGFTYGAGLEYALSRSFSIGAEYNHNQFHIERQGVEDAATTTASSHTGDPSVKTMTLRLNYKFAPSPF